MLLEKGSSASHKQLKKEKHLEPVPSFSMAQHKKEEHGLTSAMSSSCRSYGYGAK